MTDKAIISLGDTKFEAPVIVGSEGERAIDIGQLRAKTGYVTIDPAGCNGCDLCVQTCGPKAIVPLGSAAHASSRVEAQS